MPEYMGCAAFTCYSRSIKGLHDTISSNIPGEVTFHAFFPVGNFKRGGMTPGFEPEFRFDDAREVL